MSEGVQDDLPVDRSGLLDPPENFRVLLDVDGKQFGIVLSAYNRRSIVALLQFLMLANRKRVGGYIVKTEALIVGGSGDLVASVPAGSFIDQMAQHSRLKDPAPKQVPRFESSSWDAVQVKPKGPLMSEQQKFIVELVIDGIAEKFPVTGANEESVTALLTAAAAANMPRIAGFNLYDEAGKMLATVPVMMFLQRLAELTPLGKAPADPKAAGWRAVPAIIPTSEQWMKDVNAAKKDGRMST